MAVAIWVVISKLILRYTEFTWLWLPSNTICFVLPAPYARVVRKGLCLLRRIDHELKLISAPWL
jgi:hypothetical protein